MDYIDDNKNIDFESAIKKNNKKNAFLIISIICLVFFSLIIYISYVHMNRNEIILKHYREFLLQLTPQKIYSNSCLPTTCSHSVKNAYYYFMTLRSICPNNNNRDNCINETNSEMKKSILSNYSYNCDNINNPNCSIDDMYYFVMPSHIFPEFLNTTYMNVIKDYTIEIEHNFSYNDMNKDNIKQYYEYMYILSSFNNNTYGDSLIEHLENLKSNDIKSKYYKILIYDLYLINHNYTPYNYTALYHLPFSKQRKDEIISDICFSDKNEEISKPIDKYYNLVVMLYCGQFQKNKKAFYDFISVRSYDLEFLGKQIGLYNYITRRFNL